MRSRNGAERKFRPRNLIVMESNGTAERFVREEPPTYTLSYKDAKGLVQTIPRQFYADPGKTSRPPDVPRLLQKFKAVRTWMKTWQASAALRSAWLPDERERTNYKTLTFNAVDECRTAKTSHALSTAIEALKEHCVSILNSRGTLTTQLEDAIASGKDTAKLL